MIFYDCSTAPSPRRARMFIAEKGLEIETRQVSIAEGAQLKSEFLALNPRATLPVLVLDDGTVLTENLGIAACLEALHPEPPLLGRNPAEKGLVAMWTAIAEQQGGQPVAEVFRNGNPHMKGRAVPGPQDHDQIPALVERGRARVATFFELIETRLQNSPFLATDHFTLADMTAFVFLDFARVIRTRIPENNRATRTWFDNISARPSAQI
ncbi:glutathione S-transferase [Rhodobacteraceae bacterium F11138]|nr:glutathione S-transferase [Rhodobacteraceae bacterium F11138]